MAEVMGSEGGSEDRKRKRRAKAVKLLRRKPLSLSPVTPVKAGVQGRAASPRPVAPLSYPASQVSYQEVVAQRGLLATFCTDLFATEMKLKLTRLMIGSSFIASAWNCR